MSRCVCCGMWLAGRGECTFCDAVLSSPPHVCLRWLELVPDEHGCEPGFGVVAMDHETAWRLDPRDPYPS